MRTTQNPNKDSRIKPLERVTVLVVTHLPETKSAYHKDRMSVISKSLVSLLDNANIEINFIVWDNGSCDTLRDYLKELPIDSLILSRNIGKTNALKFVMRGLPEGSIFAYGDDDIEYFDDWLRPQIEILENFPQVGTVTGYPTVIQGRWAKHPNIEGSQIESGKFIPQEWERDFALAHGREWNMHYANTLNDKTTRITYKGLQAYCLGHHCQFVCYPEKIEPLYNWSDRAMLPEQPIDKEIDNAGLYRFSTINRYARHIGNVL